MSARRKLSTAARARLHARFDGRCGYCGEPVSLRAMHADHVDAVYRGGSSEEPNFLPACRTCNLRKETHDVEGFRREIAAQPQRLMRIAGFRLVVRLGLVVIKDGPVRFHFEGQP